MARCSQAVCTLVVVVHKRGRSTTPPHRLTEVGSFLSQGILTELGETTSGSLEEECSRKGDGAV